MSSSTVCGYAYSSLRYGEHRCSAATVNPPHRSTVGSGVGAVDTVRGVAHPPMVTGASGYPGGRQRDLEVRAVPLPRLLDVLLNPGQACANKAASVL